MPTESYQKIDQISMVKTFATQGVNTSKQEEETYNIYEEVSDWHVNTGDEEIIAKRIPGRYRLRKWIGMSVWLVFFLGPYLRWNGHQAFLFDIANRQFHFFSTTIFPQDIWMLSLTLLFFAVLLAAVTSIAGRVFCGYFCFQTVWTDIYTYIESRLEGASPSVRKKFKDSPWTLNKVWRKVTKHALWIAIALFTGLSFAAWFTDVYQLWYDFFTLNASMAAWACLAVFGVFTYGFAGFMREQVCFWLCPYARLQSVMYDEDTVLPAYDAKRGEPRGKLKKGDDGGGSCIDCKVCVAVCPTGIDIRQGQQEGCITCGMCIDACDSIMDKIDQPRGLIRYASYKELQTGDNNIIPLYKRPRVVVYGLILTLSLLGVIYGFTDLSPTSLSISHERNPLYVSLSDGSIQNKYRIEMLNKTQQPITVTYSVSGLKGATLSGLGETITIPSGELWPVRVFVKVHPESLKKTITPIIFKATVKDHPEMDSRTDSVFIGPK